MKYNDRISIIYDCIVYGVLYFNRKNMNKLLLNDDIRPEPDTYEHFDLAFESSICPPKYLYPFFYFGNIPSPLTQYFFRYVNFHNDNFPDFINHLKDKNKFRDFILDILLSDLEPYAKNNIIYNNDIVEFMTALDKLRYNEKMKSYLPALISNFNVIADELILFFEKLLPSILNMHKRNCNLIHSVFLELPTNTGGNLLCKHFGINENTFNGASVSISLFNKYMSHVFVNDTFYLLGVSYEKSLNIKYTYKHISVESFLLAMGDESRHLIVNKLNKPGESLTASQLSRILNISISSVRRHIEILLNEMILKINKREAREIYLSINEEYYKNIKVKLNKYFDGYIINNI